MREMIDIPEDVRAGGVATGDAATGDAETATGPGGGGSSVDLSDDSDTHADDDEVAVSGSKGPNKRSAVPPKRSVHSVSLSLC